MTVIVSRRHKSACSIRVKRKRERETREPLLEARERSLSAVNRTAGPSRTCLSYITYKICSSGEADTWITRWPSGPEVPRWTSALLWVVPTDTIRTWWNITPVRLLIVYTLSYVFIRISFTASSSISALKNRVNPIFQTRLPVVILRFIFTSLLRLILPFDYYLVINLLSIKRLW